MTAFDIFLKLENAFGASTHNNNYFLQALNSINWDSTFYADGEHYFIKGGFTFTTTSLDPFAVEWKPEALFADGSCISF